MHVDSNVSSQDGHAKVEVDYWEQWAAFDKLPKTVRQVIANMPVEFSVLQIAQEYWQAKREYFISDADYARHLDTNFREFVRHESVTKQERSPYEYTVKPRPKTRRVYERPQSAGMPIYRR